GVVAAAADLVAGVEVRATLADNDRPRVYPAAVVHLDAEALGSGVTAVAGGAATLGLGHRLLASPGLDTGCVPERNVRDLDRHVVLAVTPALAVVGLVLVSEPADLGSLGIAHHARRDLGGVQVGGRRHDPRAVDDQHRPER